MSSTSDVCVEFWEYPGKTRSPIMRSLTVPISHLYTLLANAAYDDLDTYFGWRMVAFQKTCCMVNRLQGTKTKVVPNFVTKTSASGI